MTNTSSHKLITVLQNPGQTVNFKNIIKYNFEIWNHFQKMNTTNRSMKADKSLHANYHKTKPISKHQKRPTKPIRYSSIINYFWDSDNDSFLEAWLPGGCELTESVSPPWGIALSESDLLIRRWRERIISSGLEPVTAGNEGPPLEPVKR